MRARRVRGPVSDIGALAGAVPLLVMSYAGAASGGVRDEEGPSEKLAFIGWFRNSHVSVVNADGSNLTRESEGKAAAALSGGLPG